MDIEIFEKFNNDKSVYKFGGWHGEFFLNDENNIIIGFVFLHKGYKFNTSSSEKRIIYEVIKTESYQGGKPLKRISNEALFLVNVDHPAFSILFKSSIDSKNRIAKLELIEPPKSGLSLLSKEEKEGISIGY